MKVAIKAYLTALINTHRNAISPNVSSLVNSCTRKSITELNDLLVFVTAIPEETVTDTYKEINVLRESMKNHYRDSEKIVIKNVTLKKRVAELEESCGNMNEIEINLHEQISLLESDMTELKIVNTGVWEENRQIKLLNKQSFRKIKLLKNKLKNKLRGDC